MPNRAVINYETLLKVTKAISHSKDPEEVALMTVESIKTALGAKGCSLFLVNRKNNELQLATSYGLSDEYINKGLKSSIDILKTMREVQTHLEDNNESATLHTIGRRVRRPQL